MDILSYTIKPFYGTEIFQLGSRLPHIKKYLKDNNIKFIQKVDPNKGCRPEVPWTYFEIDKSISLCFVKDVLFEIVFENNYSGNLENGIRLGMNILEAEKIDSTLVFDDDDEDYISKGGYWLEDDIETGKIVSIAVFLPEVDKDDFFKYEWIVNYQ